MTFLEIIRLLLRYSSRILSTALLLAVLVFISTRKDKNQYQTHALLNTGLISGYNIESNKGNRVDFAYTNNEMENLINLASSYETHKELSAKLLAYCLTNDKEGKLAISKENRADYEEAMISLPDLSNIEPGLLWKEITEHRDRDMVNPFYNLTNSKNPFFSLTEFEKISVKREGKSDMIRMEYTGIDPFMTQLTLDLLIDIFISKHKSIKEGQTNNVIEFFEAATKKTSIRLKQAEDRLLNFSVENKIINYYEQTRFIAGNKEELDKQYQRETQFFAGASSALGKVNLELGDNDIIPELQAKLVEQRYAIAENSNELSSFDLLLSSEIDLDQSVLQSSLNGQIDSIRNEMNLASDQIMDMSQTPEGIANKELLDQWLINTMLKEGSAAKIEVMKEQQAEFGAIYDQFAPLGSTLKRLEREIDVAEREYMENLHSYNEARMHKYNMEMSSNVRVIDAPYFPAQPEKSKRMLMVVLAFIVGIVLPTALIIGLEFMDSTLKNPENACIATKLPFAGLLPKTPLKTDSQNIDFESLNRQALNLFLQRIRAASIGENQPKNVILFSTNPAEGKSHIIELLNGMTKGEFNFIEIPAILHESYTENTVKSGDIHILVARANRKWTTADKHAIKVYRKLAGVKPLLFLNGVGTNVMEDVIGEIPRQRSWFRQAVKGFLFHGFKKEVYS